MNLTAALLDAERPLTADDIAERVTGYADGQGSLPAHLRARQGGAAPAGHPDPHRTDPGELSRGARLPDRPGRLRAARSGPGPRRARRPPTGPAGGPGRGADRRRIRGTLEARWSWSRPTTCRATHPAAPRRRVTAVRPLARAALQRRARAPGRPFRLLVHRRRRRAGGRAVAPRVPTGSLVPHRLRPRPGEANATSGSTGSGARWSSTSRARFTGPPAGAPAEPDQPWAYGDGEAVIAVLRVDGEQARWALEQLGADSVIGHRCRRHHHLRGARHLVARLPVVRAQLPRPCRGAGAGRPARRRDLVARRHGREPSPGEHAHRPGPRSGACSPSCRGSPVRPTAPPSRRSAAASTSRPTSSRRASTRCSWSVCTRTRPTPSSTSSSTTTACASPCPTSSPDRCGSRRPRPSPCSPPGGASSRCPAPTPTGPLARGLAKLADTLGTGSPAVVEVDLGEAPGEALACCSRPWSTAAASRSTTTATAATPRSVRRVDPWRVQAEQGQWYLEAWCHRSDGRAGVPGRPHPVGHGARRPPSNGPRGRARSRSSGPRRTTPASCSTWPRRRRGWSGQYPVEAVEERTDGRVRVTLAIAARPGSSACCCGSVPTPPWSMRPRRSGDAGPAAARRVLDRYGG